MADKVLLLDIVTPDRNLYSGEAKMVIAPGAAGEVGILPLHAPLLIELKVGELRFKKDECGREIEEYVALSGGFMEVLEDHVMVIAPAAEFAREIDIERAKAAVEKAQEELKKKENVAAQIPQAALARAETRLKIAKRTTK